MRFSAGSYVNQPHVVPPPSRHCSPCHVFRLEFAPIGLPRFVVRRASTSRSLSGPTL
jgi:hypothetical protein